MSVESDVELHLNGIKQPNWGSGHVRSVEQLSEGAVYIYHTLTVDFSTESGSPPFIPRKLTYELEILKLPKANTQLVMVDSHDYRFNGRMRGLSMRTLCELGLTPNVNGCWSTDWLEDPSVEP